ncbi:MAG: hypothetical protein LBU53_06705 [Zoogloeaceae bacterium]|nr:hypothetical protein [Zoogloeaceae bacterium]
MSQATFSARMGSPLKKQFDAFRGHQERLRRLLAQPDAGRRVEATMERAADRRSREQPRL